MDMLNSLSSCSEVSQYSSELVIVEASEEHQGPPSERSDVLERVKSGKKRAKKLRHRMAGRTRELEGPSPVVQQSTSPASQTRNRAK